jgi:hypothetical protein
MIVEQEYADAMKMLARQYYEHEISKSVYRAKRKLLVDHMDNEFNGEAIPGKASEQTSAEETINPLE